MERKLEERGEEEEDGGLISEIVLGSGRIRR